MITYMEDERLDMLENFFAGCFNQDWRLEADNPDELVENYVKAVQSREEFVSLSILILSYSEKFSSDEELEKNLLSELHCYYQPSLDGISAKSWLQHVARELKAAANSR